MKPTASDLAIPLVVAKHIGAIGRAVALERQRPRRRLPGVDFGLQVGVDVT